MTNDLKIPDLESLEASEQFPCIRHLSRIDLHHISGDRAREDMLIALYEKEGPPFVFSAPQAQLQQILEGLLRRLQPTPEDKVLESLHRIVKLLEERPG